MTSTTIRQDDRPVVTADPAPVVRRRPTRRTAAALVVGVVAVVGASIGASYVAHRTSGPAEATTGTSQARSFADAAESAHGTRAGLRSGTGVALVAAVAPTPNDAASLAHGAAGAIRSADGRLLVARSGSGR